MREEEHEQAKPPIGRGMPNDQEGKSPRRRSRHRRHARPRKIAQPQPEGEDHIVDIVPEDPLPEDEADQEPTPLWMYIAGGAGAAVICILLFVAFAKITGSGETPDSLNTKAHADKADLNHRAQGLASPNHAQGGTSPDHGVSATHTNLAAQIAQIQPEAEEPPKTWYSTLMAWKTTVLAAVVATVSGVVYREELKTKLSGLFTDDGTNPPPTCVPDPNQKPGYSGYAVLAPCLLIGFYGLYRFGYWVYNCFREETKEEKAIRKAPKKLKQAEEDKERAEEEADDAKEAERKATSKMKKLKNFVSKTKNQYKRKREKLVGCWAYKMASSIPLTSIPIPLTGEYRVVNVTIPKKDQNSRPTDDKQLGQLEYIVTEVKAAAETGKPVKYVDFIAEYTKEKGWTGPFKKGVKCKVLLPDSPVAQDCIVKCNTATFKSSKKLKRYWLSTEKQEPVILVKKDKKKTFARLYPVSKLTWMEPPPSKEESSAASDSDQSGSKASDSDSSDSGKRGKRRRNNFSDDSDPSGSQSDDDESPSDSDSY